jgi:hypothetical protein
MRILLLFWLSAAGALAVATPNAAQEPLPIATSNAAQKTPGWLSGVWTRDWIEERGRRSSTLDVHYLQTLAFFGDLRIPLDRPKFPQAASFADLSDQELHALAQQHAFAGLTTLAGTVSTWHHYIDFQPPDGEEDVGRLELLADGRMYEHGLDGAYTESWRSVSHGEGRFLVIQTESGGRPQRLLLVAGDYFMYVRNRGRDLPAAASLDALISSTRAAREQIIEYLDCEFSFGRVRSGSIPWEIHRSTLPWREGRPLEFVDQIDLLKGGNGIRLRTPKGERSTVPINTLTESELAAIVPGRGR